MFLLATIIAGCTLGEPGRGPIRAQTPSLVTRALPEGWTRCVNEVEGWSVGYPKTWFTTDVYTDALTGRDVPRPRSACTRFDPEPFTIPLDGDPSYMAVEAGIARSRIEEEIASLTDPAFYRTLLQERWIVLGRRAVRLEVESLGDGLTLKARRRYGWIVDLGGDRSFSVLATASADVSRERYGSYREVADRAIATVAL